MRLKALWEDYTPEQEAEQSRWRAAFKIKYPGRDKRRRNAIGMKKTDQDLSAAPDPFDTKPVGVHGHKDRGIKRGLRTPEIKPKDKNKTTYSKSSTTSSSSVQGSITPGMGSAV